MNERHHMSKHSDWKESRTCVYNVGYHLVWSTKYRRQVITGPVEDRIKALFQEIANQYELELGEMEVMPDHCHIFVSCHPKIPPSHLAKWFKGITARKLFMEFPWLKSKLWKGHLWNPSYYVGTVGNMSKDVVLRYIQNQKVHSPS